MSTRFYMSDDLFAHWTDLLIDQAYDWKQIGISNDYCNRISVPLYGIELVQWMNQLFNIVDSKKYTLFLLRYS